jgi:hypothetical protein
MIYFVTFYSVPTGKTKRKGMKTVPVFESREYRTKSLTPMHPHIRNTYGGRTVRCNTEVPWPFGVYGEVVAEAPKP